MRDAPQANGTVTAEHLSGCGTNQMPVAVLFPTAAVRPECSPLQAARLPFVRAPQRSRWTSAAPAMPKVGKTLLPSMRHQLAASDLRPRNKARHADTA